MDANFNKTAGAVLNPFIDKVPVRMAVMAVFVIMLLSSGCKPDPENHDQPDQDYTLTIQGTSNIDKKIQDGTTAWFVEQGRNDTTFKSMQNEQASIKLHAAEGRTIQGTAGIKENNGHNATKQAVYLEENTTLPLIMTAKQHTITINYTINANNVPVNNAIITTPQETTRTNEQGKGSTTISSVNTDQYNNINHTLEGMIESDTQTSIKFDQKTFSYILTTTTKDVTEDVNQKNYNSTITIDSNIAGALLYVLHQADTIAKANANTTGDATFNIERTQEAYNVTVGANKTDYVKDEEALTLQGDQDYNINLTLNPASHTKTVNFTITSSETTKTPKSFRGYVLVAGDTLAVKNFNTNNGQLQYNTNNANETAEVGATNIPAHQDIKQNMTLTGTHNFNGTATITYQNTNVPVLIIGERGLPIQGVSITGFGSAKTTGTDGKTTLDMILGADKTDTNGLPFSSYTTNITLASDNIINQTTSIQHTPGTNNQKNITAKRTNYPYTININITSSNPTKTPLGFTGSIIIAGETTAVQNYNGTSGQLTFNNSAPNINAQATATNIPYHSNATAQNVTLDGSDSFNFVANADVTHYNVTGNVSDENSTPMSANVSTEGKNDDTDSNGNYAINDIEQRRGTNNQPLTYTIDVTATGEFDTQNKSTTADGTNKNVNFIIPVQQQNYTYNITIETYGPRLATPVTNGTIEITTMSDGMEHATPIDNDGITNITITGPYAANEAVRVKINDNNYYTTGTFALLKNGQTAIAGKIGSRIGLPGYINHELTTTIDDIDDATGVYATMFADSLQNNTALMESINNYYGNSGVATWSPKDAQGNLIETIIFYNKTTDVNGNPVPQARIDRQKAALEFVANQNTTGAGKTLYNKTYMESGSIPPTPTAHTILFLDNIANAGNARSYTSPNEFRGVTASTRDYDSPNTDILELTEGLGINDNSSGSNGFSVTVDGTGKINGFSESGLKAWVTDFTYQPADFKK